MTDTSAKTFDVPTLDAWTSGAFSAPTSGERAARLREWLQTQPDLEQIKAVATEMAVRDKGASKVVREKLDELRRIKDQDALVQSWAAKGEALRDAPSIQLADAMAWQRDAAKAGAPLSREPLASLKTALAERVKAIEDLQHQAQVQREAAVLLAHRIEVLSTKSWTDAQAQREALQADLAHWNEQAQALAASPQWSSVDPKFSPALQTSAQQIQAVWEAFDAALTLTQAAANDASAPLPEVPAWADQLRVARGEAPVASSASTAASPSTGETPRVDPTRTFKPSADKAVVDQKRTELAEQAEALFKPGTEEPVIGGRKLQDSLRQLREQWKKVDKEAAPNPALWKRFDTACTRAHAVVDAWLKEVRAQGAAHKAQRLALIEEVKAWTQAHAQGPDWKAVARQLHQFSQRWREGGHLSEKLFAELQPVWKQVIHAAHEPLEAAQNAGMARRKALIAEAQALAAAPTLRIDAVKDLQHRWQEEAHTVMLDRKQEQKLWDAFRQPLDQAFSRKSSARDASDAALSPRDKAVLEAAKALEAASEKGDAAEIRAAMTALDQVLRGEVVQPKTEASQPAAEVMQPVSEAPAEDTPADSAPPEAAPAAAPRPVVAVRGDDRPGQKRTEPAAALRGRDAKPGQKAGFKSAGRGDDARAPRAEREPSAPRLGDAAFRAQRHAMEEAQGALRKLAAQAHGEVLTHLMQAWSQRNAELVPNAQALGGKLSPAQRSQWVQVVSAPAQGDGGTALLRLEVAADLPTPAALHDARRALQLQLLTRRNDPAPAATWAADAAQVLGSAHDDASARRLLAVLKVLLKR